MHSESGLPFFEVYLSTSLETCEARDVKGLYKRARAGDIKNFTGLDSPYEVPVKPDLVLKTDELSVAECVDRCLQMLSENVGFSVLII